MIYKYTTSPSEGPSGTRTPGSLYMCIFTARRAMSMPPAGQGTTAMTRERASHRAMPMTFSKGVEDRTEAKGREKKILIWQTPLFEGDSGIVGRSRGNCWGWEPGGWKTRPNPTRRDVISGPFSRVQGALAGPAKDEAESLRWRQGAAAGVGQQRWRENLSGRLFLLVLSSRGGGSGGSAWTLVVGWSCKSATAG